MKVLTAGSMCGLKHDIPFMKIFFKIHVIAAMAIMFTHCGSPPNEGKPKAALKPIFNEPSVYYSTVLESAYKKLQSGDTLSKTEILDFSKDISTRVSFYNLLRDFHQQTLFPAEYDNFEKAAESVLANWLSYPTELDTIPSEMELIKKVNHVENDTTFIYYVFKFKTNEPHWAAKDGWMIGAVGPYFNDSYPYDWTTGTFSKFTKLKETTPEKEVEWIHKNVYRRSPE